MNRYQNADMDIREVRRVRLKEWFTGRPLPERERSYLSQLINGKSSFGEKAARRIESDYKMPSGYLDTPVSGDDADLAIELDANEQKLILLFRKFPDAGKSDMIQVFEDKAAEYDRLFDELARLRGVK